MQDMTSRLPDRDRELAEAMATIEIPADVAEFILDLALSWDCDSDGHKYGTGCRLCNAHSLMNKYQIERRID